MPTKNWVSLLNILLAGLCLGFWLGYTRPAMRAYREMKAATGWSDDEFAKRAGSFAKEATKNLDDSSSQAVLISFGAINKIDDGDYKGADELLARNLANYYAMYGPHQSVNDSGTPVRRRLLQMIEEEAKKHPVIAQAINEPQSK